jgi:hypothetical protein
VEAQPVAAPAVEREIVTDLVRRGLFAAPVIIIVAGLARGWHGLVSAALAVLVVLVNYTIAAVLMTRAKDNGPIALGVSAMVGFVVRMVIVIAALLLLRNQPWIDLVVFGIVLVATHVGLLAWETKYLSISLAEPGLRPAQPTTLGER